MSAFLAGVGVTFLALAIIDCHVACRVGGASSRVDLACCLRAIRACPRTRTMAVIVLIAILLARRMLADATVLALVLARKHFHGFIAGWTAEAVAAMARAINALSVFPTRLLANGNGRQYFISIRRTFVPCVPYPPLTIGLDTGRGSTACEWVVNGTVLTAVIAFTDAHAVETLAMLATLRRAWLLCSCDILSGFVQAVPAFGSSASLTSVIVSDLCDLLLPLGLKAVDSHLLGLCLSHHLST